MGLPDSIADRHQDYPDAGEMQPTAWVRPATTEEILEQIEPNTIGDLVFTVRVYDKEARGYRQEPQLTQTGAVTLARVLGNITTGRPVWEISDEEIACDVSATDHVTGLTVWGTSIAPLTITYTDSKTREEVTRRNEHARATALGKAQRNALAHLVPVEVEQALFQWHQEQSAGQSQQRSRPAPAPKPTPRPARRRREEYIKLLQECGDSVTLAATWKDVRRDGHEADAELMELAYKLCKSFIGDTYTAPQWNQVAADIQAIGFASDQEMSAALQARKAELQAARESES